MSENIILKGTKIVIGMYAGTAGTDAMEAYELTCDYTENELANIAWERGIEHADMYGVYPMSDLDGMSDDDLEEIDENDYSDNIEGWWEIYNPEEHDGKVIFGNSTEVTFNPL